MAAVMVNAANMAYRRSISKTRESAKTNPEVPTWFGIFTDKLKEKEADAARRPKKSIGETKRRILERTLKISKNPYDRLAWWAYEHFTSKAWFETLVMTNILAVGLATGLDLENRGRDAWIPRFVDYVGNITLGVFTAECALKIIACARQPLDYFTDPEDGGFNTMDFLIVVASYAFLGNSNAGAIGALRMLRLIRLLTFIKGVPQLRVIVIGILQGMRSVVYILMLLLLVVYIFAILGTLLFGFNDPAHFGDVGIAMLTLFQVSTLASWTNIAYVSWYGCDNWMGSPYDDARSSRINTMAGSFEGFKCPESGMSGQPFLTYVFFAFYILITSWVIMSLFIGVISMGMFDAFLAMDKENEELKSVERHELNSTPEERGKHPPSLKVKIDAVWAESDTAGLDDDEEDGRWEAIRKKAAQIRDHRYFTMLITVLILVVGVFIGVESDFTLACERTHEREDGKDDDHATSKVAECYEGHLPTLVVGDVALAFFTFEVVLKLTAEKATLNYFTDRENGPWNTLDFFIVCIGFVEKTAFAFIFEEFPVVILRLLRLLRVFRLAKALPRLRSIVEALISGFTSVGWICLLILVYQYIAGCLCMLIFSENDPFHFGSLGRSMFTVMRMQTFDTWDQMIKLAMYGCDGYPSYDLLRSNPQVTCANPEAFGWVAPLVLLPLGIIGSYILPPVLIGIVTMKFGDASKYYEELAKIKVKLKEVVASTREDMPHFITPRRIKILRAAFDAMDSSSALNLDLAEISPFLQYSFALLFGVELSSAQTESLFLIMDTNQSTEIAFSDFVAFSAIMKQVAEECHKNSHYASEVFGSSFRRSSLEPNNTLEHPNIPDLDEEDGSVQDANSSDDGSSSSSSSSSARSPTLLARHNKPGINSAAPSDTPLPIDSQWNRAMRRVDEQSMEETWDAIFEALTSMSGRTVDLSNPEHLEAAVHALFDKFDTDGNGMLDLDELNMGLDEIGARLSHRQLRAFKKNMMHDFDKSGDGSVDLAEFIGTINGLIVARKKKKVEATKREFNSIYHQLSRQLSDDPGWSPVRSRQGSAEDPGQLLEASRTQAAEIKGLRTDLELLQARNQGLEEKLEEQRQLQPALSQLEAMKAELSKLKERNAELEKLARESRPSSPAPWQQSSSSSQPTPKSAAAGSSEALPHRRIGRNSDQAKTLKRLLVEHGLVEYEGVMKAHGVSEVEHLGRLNQALIESIVPDKPIHQRKLTVLSLDNPSPLTLSSSTASPSSDSTEAGDSSAHSPHHGSGATTASATTSSSSSSSSSSTSTSSTSSTSSSTAAGAAAASAAVSEHVSRLVDTVDVSYGNQFQAITTFLPENVSYSEEIAPILLGKLIQWVQSASSSALPPCVATSRDPSAAPARAALALAPLLPPTARPRRDPLTQF